MVGAVECQIGTTTMTKGINGPVMPIQKNKYMVDPIIVN